MRPLAALLATPLLLAPALLPAQPGRLAGLDSAVVRAMRAWEVPGLALAVVHGDSVLHLEGYGTRTLGRDEPVDAHTVFAAASTTKAFTATLVGMLVDEGTLDWDRPLADALPGFALHDPYATRDLTLRDALSHRSGLARGDRLWYGTAFERAEVLRRVRHLRPSWPLRARFGYQNIMYVAAGEVVGRAARSSWDRAVRERLLEPLGMTRTTTTVRLLAGMDNVATPHARLADTVRAIPWRNVDNVGAAGALNSTAADLARWVRFQLDSGRVNGRRLVSEASFVETHTPHVVIRHEGEARRRNPYTHFRSYGLGWFLEDYRGRELVHHGGNLDGMSALVALLPEERLGVVVLTNMNGSALPTVVLRTVVDRWLGVEGPDWSATLLEAAERQRREAREREAKRLVQRVRGTRPSLPLERYAGTYEDSMYGAAAVTRDGDRLVLSAGPAFTADLEHWHYDTFLARARDPMFGEVLVSFTLDAGGVVRALRFEPTPGSPAEEQGMWMRVEAR